MEELLREKIYGIPWVGLAAIAVLVAAAYAFVPAQVPATGLHWFVLRWFHTIAWLFLAASAVARAKVTRIPVEGAAVLAATGGLIYVALMLTTLTSQN